jgi:predicted TIM-barrel fold metal-dependent hydrolase
MIVDGHAHACGEYLNHENIIANMDRLGIDLTVLTAGELGSERTYSFPDIGKRFPRSDINFITNAFIRFGTRMGGKTHGLEEANAQVFEMARDSRGRIVQAYWADPTRKEPASHLASMYEKWNFGMVKLHQCWHGFSFNDAGMRDIAGWTEETDLPVFVHVGRRKDVIPFLETVRSRSNPYIMGHMIGLEIAMREGRPPENLYADISCPSLMSGLRVKKAIEWLGSENVVIGSDTPYGKDNARRIMDLLGSLSLRGTDRQRILGGNMKRILKL